VKTRSKFRLRHAAGKAAIALSRNAVDFRWLESFRSGVANAPWLGFNILRERGVWPVPK
jgi:hypothetical protein